MGSQKSKSPDVSPQLQMCETQVKCLLEAQKKQYERKCQEEAFTTAQRKHTGIANSAAEVRKNQNEIIIAAKKKLQEEAATIAAQRKLQEEEFITAQRKLQEEVAAALAAQRKLQEEAFIAAQRKLQEEAFIAAQRKLQEVAAALAAQRKLQEEAFIAAQKKLQEQAAIEATQRKLQEEAFITAQRKFQEEAAIAVQNKLLEEAGIRKQHEEAANRASEEEAAKKALQEEAAKRKQQEDAAMRAFHEKAVKRKQQEEATKRKQQEEAAKRAFQEETAERKQQEEAAKTKQQEEAAKRAFQKPAATRPRELSREADLSRYCSTCYTRSEMKMFECEDGHGSCNDCKIKSRACGICRSNITNWRSYDIENPGPQTRVPCPNAWQGCVLNIKIADMENHVQECPFKEQDCPLAAVFGNCRWSGEITELSSHFDEMHPNYLLNKLGSELHLRNIHRDYRYIRLVESGYYFIFHLKVSQHDSKVYMAVQLIGTKKSARKWLYEIHVYNKNESRRKYMYTDNCRSSIDDMDDVFRSGECAVLPMWYADTFFNKALTYKFFILRTGENGTSFDRNQRGRDYSAEEEEDNGWWSGPCTSIIDERDLRQQPRTRISRHRRRNY